MGFFSGMLGNKSAKTKSATSLPRTSTATATRIKNILGIRELESMPMQAARAFQLASDPKANAADFVKVIEQDEALGSKIIRVANSVYFFRGTKATDIEKAVNNIGLNELRCLLTASMLKSLLISKHPLRKQLWANAIAVGICCRNLSRTVENVGSGEAFLAGLVHDIGKLVMLRKLGNLYEKVLARVSFGELTFTQAEEELFETNHIEIGKWVAESWNFPDPVIYAIGKHHDPFPKDEGNKERHCDLAMLVKSADIIAHAKGLGHPSAFRGFQRMHEEQLAVALARVGILEANSASFLNNFLKEYEEEASMFEMEN
ncbi:MAG: HDOD domain-containing protein [Deltaproteobacteria bacterium]|nr:HDOD domain-containing protein [Deltaproteobacteria bacterium]